MGEDIVTNTPLAPGLVACLGKIIEAIHASLVMKIDEAKKRYRILHHVNIGNHLAYNSFYTMCSKE